ncbi:MAG: hypothetical protein ACOCXS_00590 [Bacteroidota bacterium]
MSKRTALIVGILILVTSVIFRMLDNAGRIAFDSELMGFIFGFLVCAALTLIIRGIFGKK